MSAVTQGGERKDQIDQADKTSSNRGQRSGRGQTSKYSNFSDDNGPGPVKQRRWKAVGDGSYVMGRVLGICQDSGLYDDTDQNVIKKIGERLRLAAPNIIEDAKKLADEESAGDTKVGNIESFEVYTNYEKGDDVSVGRGLITYIKQLVSVRPFSFDSLQQFGRFPTGVRLTQTRPNSLATMRTLTARMCTQSA